MRHWKLIIPPPSLWVSSFSEISGICATSNFALNIQTTVKLGPFVVNTGLHTCILTETVCICHTLNWPDSILSKPHRFPIGSVQRQFRIHFSQLKLSVPMYLLRLRLIIRFKTVLALYSSETEAWKERMAVMSSKQQGWNVITKLQNMSVSVPN